jgi:hypothetical protein
MLADQAKYTVMLTPRSVAALKAAATDNQETRTNVINRGIQLYRLATQLIGEGMTLVARGPDGGERQIELL